MSGRLLVLCTSVICLAIGTASRAAELIVHWGGNYVTADKPFSNAGENMFGGFVDGDPLLLSPSSDYTGGPFYGQVLWDVAGLDGGYGRIKNGSNNDLIEIKRYNTDLRAVILWRQADFENGYDTGNVAFDATSTISMYLENLTRFNFGRVVIRLQGGDKDGYYISEERPFDRASTMIAVHPTELTWLAYDPATSLTAVGSAVDLVTNGRISHVTEVGFFAHSEYAPQPNAFRVQDFEVTAVPEPAALSLLGMGALILRRRRR